MSIDFNSLSQANYERAIIMGVTKFSGEIEGQKIDSCTVFLATPFNTEQGNAVGLGVSKVRFGGSANFARFSALSFPLQAEVLFEKVVNGSGKQTSILKDVRLQAVKG